MDLAGDNLDGEFAAWNKVFKFGKLDRLNVTVSCSKRGGSFFTEEFSRGLALASSMDLGRKKEKVNKQKLVGKRKVEKKTLKLQNDCDLEEPGGWYQSRGYLWKKQ